MPKAVQGVGEEGYAVGSGEAEGEQALPSAVWLLQEPEPQGEQVVNHTFWLDLTGLNQSGELYGWS